MKKTNHVSISEDMKQLKLSYTTGKQFGSFFKSSTYTYQVVQPLHSRNLFKRNKTMYPENICARIFIEDLFVIVKK